MSRQVDVVIGTQYGDEGKGRVVDEMASDYNVVARYNGGPNAGHTIITQGGHSVALHQIPSGILHEGTFNIIGNGVFFDPVAFLKEQDSLIETGIDVSAENLAISGAAHLILPHQILRDRSREAGTAAQGSTSSGIAYAAADKGARSGARAEMLVSKPDKLRRLVYDGLARQYLRGYDFNIRRATDDWLEQSLGAKSYIQNTEELLQQFMVEGNYVLAEGAQGWGLDLEHGSYPFTTSSNTGVGGAVNGLGISHRDIDRVYGVAKAFKSRVGRGPFVTELKDEELAEQVRGEENEPGREFGATTGRKRRIGYLDLPEVRAAMRANGVDEIALTKLDWLPKFGERITVCVGYSYRGKEIKYAPSGAAELEQCEPIYLDQALELWSPDETVNLRAANSLETMPDQAQRYIKVVNEELGRSIHTIGVGPERGQKIKI